MPPTMNKDLPRAPTFLRGLGNEPRKTARFLGSNISVPQKLNPIIQQLVGVPSEIKFSDPQIIEKSKIYSRKDIKMLKGKVESQTYYHSIKIFKTIRELRELHSQLLTEQ
jgi:hypothetical protein